jgi:hypothetical protein
MWSVDYVQVPKEDKLGLSHDESEENGEGVALTCEVVASTQPGRDTTTTTLPDKDSVQRAKQQRVADLVKQMSLSAEFSTNESGIAVIY